MEKSIPKLKLKLLIDAKSNRVLFAESNKEFVDFLFSLLSLPLGTIVKLLKAGGMVGSMGDLFRSIESLDQTYLQSSNNVKSLLDPNPASIAFKNPLLLPDCESASQNAYMCLYQTPTGGYSSSHTVYHSYVSDSPKTACASCKKPMNHRLQVVDSYSSNQGAESSSGGGSLGFVKGVVTYMILDNLEVKPLSTISSIALINSFHIRDLSCLQEMAVGVGTAQALKLLRASLQTKNVLTSVFLSKKEVD